MNFKSEHRDIVELLRTGRKGVHRRFDGSQKLFGREIDVLVQGGHQTVVAVKLGGRVDSLRYAVRVKENAIARAKLNRP